MTRSDSGQVPVDKNGLQLARPFCYKCIRPESHCLCSRIQSFEAHCNILILQHPHEKRKYYSTAKLVKQSLTNSRIMRSIEFEENLLKQALSATNPYLLFPGPDAMDCEKVSLSSHDTVIVLDGTWSEAGKLLSRNPILQTLPKLSFTRPLKSEYKIRKQPKEKYLSTIESIGHLLKLNLAACGLNSETEARLQKNYDGLFEVFSLMVDRQLTYFPRFNSVAAPG